MMSVMSHTPHPPHPPEVQAHLEVLCEQVEKAAQHARLIYRKTCTARPLFETINYPDECATIRTPTGTEYADDGDPILSELASALEAQMLVLHGLLSRF